MGGGLTQGFGGAQGFGGQGGVNTAQQQQLDQTLSALNNVLDKLGTNQQGQTNSFGRQLTGNAEDSRELVDASIRQQAPIFVGVIKHQNRVLVRTRDADAMQEIRQIYKRLDVESSMLLMEVKILSIDISDGFNSLFDIKLNNGSVQTSTLSQAANIAGSAANGASSATTTGGAIAGAAAAALQTGATAFNPALLITAVSKNFELSMQLLESQGRVTQLATPILLTSNQEVSRFFVGTDIPVVTGYSSGSVQITGSLTSNTITVPPTPTYTNRQVGNTLLLTPNINADNTVSIQGLVEQSQLVTNGTNIIVSNGTSLVSQPIDTVQKNVQRFGDCQR